MFRKIKKYKITLRPSSIMRNLKKKLAPEPISDSIEKMVGEERFRIEPLIIPSATYETYSNAITPESLKSLWNSSPKHALSLSLMAVTVGPLLEREIDEQRNKNDRIRQAIIDSIARESLEQSLNFVEKLLSEEAKSEGCELFPPLPVEPKFLKDLLAILESHKTEINLDDNNQLTPIFSSVSFCFWKPLRRGSGTIKQ